LKGGMFMQEKKSWGLFRMIFIFCFVEVLVLLARAIGFFTFSWWYAFTPLLLMYVSIFAYMGIALLIETIKENNYKKQNLNFE